MSKSKFSHVRIAGITGVVPEKCINIDDEIQFYGGDEKLLKRNKSILGLGTRHVIDDRTTMCDLCQLAAERLLQELQVDRESIDALVVVSTSHDYYYPASSCVLHGRLGLADRCTCFDMAGLACSGYVHGLNVVHSMVESGMARRCLLLVGDISSVHSDRRNRNVNMLFGDAGTATLVEYTAAETQSWFVTGTRGAGWEAIIAPAGGFDIPVRNDIANVELVDGAGNVWHLWEDIMKGMDVFRFTTDVGPQGIRDVLELSGKKMEEIDYFAFHQANKQIVRTVASYAEIPREKFSTDTFTKYANCSTASVATDICNTLHDRNPGCVCLVTFGVGLSWGHAVVDFSQTKICDIGLYKTPGAAKSREEKIAHWINSFKQGNK